MGRFINADTLVSTGQGVLGNNMFAYCANSPVGLSDPYGYCAGSIAIPREGAAYTGLCPVCGACGGGSGGGGIPINLEKAATGITSAASKILVWTFEAVNFSAAASGTYVQDTTGLQKAKKTPPDGQYQYWEAYRIDGNVYVGRGLSLWNALIRVEMELDVMCINRDAAFLLIRINGYIHHVGPEIDKGRENDENYYYHYHALRDSSAHIWYYVR